jgi:hypothetical protein
MESFHILASLKIVQRSSSDPQSASRFFDGDWMHHARPRFLPIGFIMPKPSPSLGATPPQPVSLVKQATSTLGPFFLPGESI